MNTLLVMYLVIGLGLIAVSIPLLLEKIPPNPLYGFRISPAIDDPKIWYPTNKHSAKRLIAAGLSTLLAAVAFQFVPGISIDVYALSCLGIFSVVFVVGLVQSVRFMNSLAKHA